MAILAIMVVPDFLESDMIYQDLVNLTKLGKVPEYLLQDIAFIR